MVGTVLAALILLVMSPASVGRSPARADRVALNGHVLVSIEKTWLGAGLGLFHSTFIFGVRSPGTTALSPVKISYVFAGRSDQLRDDFFDYSRQYELQVSRDPECDEKLDDLLAIRNKDGTPLPPGDGPRALKGAPEIHMRPNSILPCYSLRPGDYRLAAAEKK
jgi:hypothetical protein